LRGLVACGSPPPGSPQKRLPRVSSAPRGGAGARRWLSMRWDACWARPAERSPGVGSSVGCVLFSMPKHGGRGGLPRRWMCGLVRIRVRAASEARNFLGGSRPGSAGLRRRPAGRAAAVARCPSEFAPGCCRPRAWHRGGSAQGSIQVKGLIGETGRRRGTLRANTESDVQTAWGGSRGSRLQTASCKRAGRTGDSRPPALRKGAGRTGGVISRHSPMAVSRGTHRFVQGTRS
jgi:hypothetical protein